MLLETAGLTKDYGRYRALDNLDLTLNPGEILGLLGPNGSGKTTALRCIMGFLRPTSGNAWINKFHSWNDGVAARKHVSYLPGELRLYESMTGRQLVVFLSRLRAQPIRAELDRLALRLDIDLDRPIANLSSGMKRKVALLQVLAPHTPLVILDEPTNTLDPNMREELLLQLRQARDQGQTVLFSSHVLSEVEQVCDRVAILKQGKLVHLQAMADLRDFHVLRATFSQMPPADVSPLPDMRERERKGRQIIWEHHGNLRPALEWLAKQPLDDVRIDPMGMDAVYKRYHGVVQ